MGGFFDELGRYLGSANNRGEILGDLGEHIYLALVPLVIGIVIAIVLGWLGHRWQPVRSVLLVVANLLYTIPSLALFVVVPGLIGSKILDSVNVIVALTIYTAALLATTSDDVYAQLKQSLPAGFEVLDQAPAQDKDLLVVRPELAASGVRTFSDLGRRCGELVMGGPGQWSSRWKDRIEQLYGCSFKEIRTTDTGGPVTVAALKSGEVQVADLFSTSSTIMSNGFVPLDDDKNMFPAQNIVPLVARGTLSPAEVAALNRVSAALTTDQLTELNVQFTDEKRNPLDIADDFLARNHLKA
ncbi:glycine betaine ABC transporter substrate-binding protein [Amycolatopsis sp. NPDC051373]|uniref:glycine betaine ABC transporter substrate-binding protein n=1 Tax=Amycolatopsis sp. NPDC051373 TaxID=3155801 RepID=UPI00344B5B7E